MIKEIRRCKANFTSETVTTIYFGGGTPSVLTVDQIGRIMTALHESFEIAGEAEITIEANPGTIGSNDVKRTLHHYRDLGFNRLSMGVQSLNDGILKFIGRIHTAGDVRRDYNAARSAGFDNINLDLIMSIPADNSREQTLADLRELISMRPEHISCYSLQIEEDTPFGKLYDEGKLNEISDEEDRGTYHEVCAHLKVAGYEHYEISNWARAGEDAGAFGAAERAHSPYRSRHNSAYWNMSDYIAFGLGASGFVNGTRYRNTVDMTEYLKGEDIREEVHRNSEHDNISEAVFTGLRRIEGIRYEEAVRFLGSDTSDTEKRFWQYYADEKAEAECFIQSGHLIADKDGMRLTEKGIDISNAIMALFV